MSNTIIYEFPLNERIRVFIRLEQLFQQFSHFSLGSSDADKRAAIIVLLDIMMIFRRNDLKSEILKELERDTKALQKITTNQTIDTNRLSDILTQLADISKKLYATSGKIGLHIMENDLFQSVAQRSSIPGGTCSFDLPEYYYWLQQDEERRLHDLKTWFAPFAETKIAIELILNFIRSSSVPSQEVAQAGFFQIALDHTQPHQLLKVSVAKSIACFAEISGGKHRCTVRFMLPSTSEKRPSQSPDDIAFELTCCAF